MTGRRTRTTRSADDAAGSELEQLAADVRATAGAQEALALELRALREELKIQSALLRLIASATARSMLIEDREHKLRYANEYNQCRDVHGLVQSVTKALALLNVDELLLGKTPEP